MGSILLTGVSDPQDRTSPTDLSPERSEHSQPPRPPGGHGQHGLCVSSGRRQVWVMASGPAPSQRGDSGTRVRVPGGKEAYGEHRAAMSICRVDLHSCHLSREQSAGPPAPCSSSAV